MNIAAMMIAEYIQDHPEYENIVIASVRRCGILQRGKEAVGSYPKKLSARRIQCRGDLWNLLCGVLYVKNWFVLG